MKTSFKKLTSIVLAVLMLLSVFAVSVSAADTDSNSTGAKTVYFAPGEANTANPAWFAWTWDGVTDQWVTGVQDGNYIRFDGCGNKIVFVRMPTGSTKGDWGTCWNQSEDLTVSDNLATFSSWNGQKFNVTWSHYSGATQATQSQPSETQATQSTQSSSGDLFLFGTIGKTDFGSGATEWNQPNQYDITSGTLTTTFTDDAYVGVKKLSTNTWYMTDGFPGMTATSATLYDADKYEFTGEKDKLHVPGGVEVTFAFVENGDGSATLSYTINGEIPTQGSESSQSTQSSETQASSNATQASQTPSNKVTINYSDVHNWDSVYVHAWSATSDLTTWPGIEMTYTGTNTFSQKQYTAEIDASVIGMVFNDGKSAQDPDAAYVEGAEGYYYDADSETVKTWGIDIPTQGSEASQATQPTQASQATQSTQGGSGDLFLFGTIGKTDFGSGATEWDQPNQYDITSGTLTTTFTDDAYVGVKKLSTNTWYMTDGFPGMTATSATLYDADKYTFTGTKDKLHVPGGVEVTFTFVENGDGSATLSYTINGEIPTQGSESSQSTQSSETQASSNATQASQTPSNKVTINYSDVHKWDSVYVHAWSATSDLTTWPGIEMTYTGTNTFGQKQYTAEIDASVIGMVFNNGDGVQDPDAAYVEGAEGYYYDAESETVKTWGIDIPTQGSEASQATQPTQGGSGDLFLFGTIGKTDFGSGATEWDQPNQYDITSGTLTTTFSDDAYVGVKKLSTNTWYMTDGFPGMTATSATLYDADKYEFTGEKDKLHVPGNVEVTFTFVENGDGSVTLSYTINGEIPTQGSDSSQSSDPTQGGSGDIFLFGTIGTVDFGSGATEWNQPNQYDLTSGTLTTTFSDDAYVGVKKLSTNTWYMTDGFPGMTATSATLYDADKYEFTGEKDKLHVPGGVEVTFTFTENGDGSATLSYTTAETSEPTQYTDPSDTQASSETQATTPTQASSETQATQQSSDTQQTQQTQQTQATYAPPSINTVYFINTPNWTTVKCYAFTGADEMGSFPGSDMIKTSYKMGGYDVYGFTLDTANYTKVIFNDGFNQTATLDVQPGKCYKPDTHNWVELNPDVETQPTQASSETQATTPTQASSETQATTPTQASSETQATTPTQASSETQATQAPATKITLTCDNTSIYVGDITVVSANVENPVGQTTFFSGSPSIASVSSLGIVQGLSAGQTYIFATNNGVTASILITVSEKPTQATQPTSETQATQPTQASSETQAPTQAPDTTITVSCSKTTIYVNATTIVTATVNNGVGTTTFTSSNTKVATVNASGKVVGKKAGSVTISATNNGKVASVKIKIIKRANPMTVKAKTVKASANKKTTIAKAKAFTIKKAKGTVTFKKVKGDKKITINKKTGKITVKKGLKKGKTYKFKVKVTAKGNTAYNAKSKTVTVKIKIK